MKKIICVGSIIFFVVAAFEISKFYLSSSFEDIQETTAISNIVETEKKVSVSASKTGSVSIASVTEAKFNNILYPRTKPDYVNDLKAALQENNELAAQIALESAAGCENCITQLIKIISDASYDNTFRKISAKALIKSGNEEGVISVLSAIFDANKQEDYDFKDELMGILATVDSVDTADILAKVLTGITPFPSDLVEMPKDVTYAIKKTLRLCSNEAVGEMLAQKYYNATSEEEKMQLMDINHPVMIARIAADAFGQGDNETANRLMLELAGVENNLAIKGMMVLIREQTISLDNVTNMMSSWSFMNTQDDQTHFMFVEYLGNAEFSPEERSLAAYAMASENDKEMAISALKKAQLFEENPLVKQYIDDALTRIEDTSQNT